MQIGTVVFTRTLRLIFNCIIFTWKLICKLYYRYLVNDFSDRNNNNMAENNQPLILNDDEEVDVEAVEGNVGENVLVDALLQNMMHEAMEVDDASSSDELSEGEHDFANDDDDFDNDNDSFYSNDDDDYSVLSSNSHPDSSESESESARFTEYLMRIWNQKCKEKHGPYIFKPLHIKRCYYKKERKRYPKARSGHRIVATESHLYALGGYNPKQALLSQRFGTCPLFQELWSFNFAANEWKQMLNANDCEEMPKELASNDLVMYKNVIISHGGTGYPFGDSCSNDCYVYGIGEKPVVKCLEVTGKPPLKLYGPSIVMHKDYLYTIGGTTGYDYYSDVYRLNLKTKEWEELYVCRPDMREDPHGRYRHETIYDGNFIYVLGGGTASHVFPLSTIHAFDLKRNRWITVDTLSDRYLLTESPPTTVHDMGYPKARKCFTCVQHTLDNGQIEAFITGGSQPLQGDFATYFSDIWKLNISTKQWTFISTSSLPRPLYFHSAAYAGNGCMYIFGGIRYGSKSVNRRNDVFKMWIKIPKLSEMCWEAVLHFNRELVNFTPDKLKAIGIPPPFLERLPKRLTETNS